MWSGAAPFGAINVDMHIGWLIGSKLEVGLTDICSSHYVLDLDLRYGLRIMLTKVLLLLLPAAASAFTQRSSISMSFGHEQYSQSFRHSRFGTVFAIAIFR